MLVRAPLLKSRLSGIWRHSADALLSNQIHRLKLELPAELPSFHTCLRLRDTLSRYPPNRVQFSNYR
jgi:hypothetical protein